MKQLTQKYTYTLSLILFGILILLPFHAFVTTWVGSNTGNLLLVRAWKELLMVVAFIVVLILLVKDTALRKKLLNDRIVIVIILFVAWQLFTASFRSRDEDALALGLAIQLRLFAIFIVARVVAHYRPVSKNLIKKLLLVPFIGVVVFGLLQMFVLPHDFLRHFGYQKNVTIPPFFTIDEQLNRIRIMSTLRGPNPLGVYLILPILLVADTFLSFLRNAKTSRQIKTSLYGTLLCISLVVLYGSHSRGAWIGMVAAAFTWALFTLPRRLKIVAMIVLVVTGISVGTLTYAYRETSFVQDVVLHDNPEEGGVTNSNAGHIDSLKLAVEDIKAKPLLGCGPGCAGPASVHNEKGVKISENYFLQTAQESGVIGLVLLLILFSLVSISLFKKRSDAVAVILLASFVGINVASLFAHAWADDTTAYVWWGIAGLFIGSYSHLGYETAIAKRLHTSEKVKTRPSN